MNNATIWLNEHNKFPLKVFNSTTNLDTKGINRVPGKYRKKEVKTSLIYYNLSCWSNKKRHIQDNQWIYIKEITKDVLKYSKI